MNFKKIPVWVKKLFRIKQNDFLNKRSVSTMINLNKLYKKLNSTEFQIRTTKTTKKEIKETRILRRLFKIVKLFFLKIELEKLRNFEQEIVNVEWKELTIRIEFIFFIVSLFTVIITPILLFGKFFLRDYITLEHLKSSCGCENSFVKNI